MLSYSELRDSLINDFTCNVNVKRIFKKVDNLVEGKDIEFFYPKNLFVDDNKFELYLFCNNIILKLGLEEGDFITTTILYKNDIKKVIVKESNTSRYKKTLEIMFKDGEEFKFDSVNDTNPYNDVNLSDIIERLFKDLVVTSKNSNAEVGEVQ